MYHIKPSSVCKDFRSLADYILQSTQDLMSCDGFRHVGIGKTVLPDHIRRIGRYYMKRSCSENLSSFFYITADNVYLRLQAVKGHASSCHIRAFFLDFKSCKMFAFCLCTQKYGNDPRSCPHIQNFFIFSDSGETGQQHSVHSETEFVRILDNIVPVLEVVQPLSLHDQIIPRIFFHELWNLLLHLPVSSVPSFPSQ